MFLESHVIRSRYEGYSPTVNCICDIYLRQAYSAFPGTALCMSMEKIIGRFSKSSDRNDDTPAVNAGSTPQSAVAASTSPGRSSDMTDEGDLFGLYQLWPPKNDVYEVQNTKIEYALWLMRASRLYHCPDSRILV